MSVLGIEKRIIKLFVRITPTNKKWIEAEAVRVGMPEAEIVDFIISEKRKRDASHSPKPARNSRKA